MALTRLVIREVDGPRAKFERYAADMLYIIASKAQLDTDVARKFGDILDAYYGNPFEKKKKKMTAAEAKDHIVKKIRDTIAHLRSE